MNTNTLKSFARQARIDLIEAVKTQLLFWGFKADGTITERPAEVDGGYTFRGEAFDDLGLIPKWRKLESRIKSAQDFKDVAEEAAYTWFNRLLAIKILEENSFIQPVLSYPKGDRQPIILKNAKAGQHEIRGNQFLKKELQKALRSNKEEKAFGILLIHYCNTQLLLKNVFGKIDDYTEILIPQDLLSPGGMVAILNDREIIVHEDFFQTELIGWLYQFYISDRKDEVFKGFKKNKKARAEDIPAATQIFTPKWIVSYMVENTLGKIYLDQEPDSALRAEMKYLVESEEEASTAEKERTKTNQGESLRSPLVIVDEQGRTLVDGSGNMLYVEGFDIGQLTLLDPACGSGHILVTGFDWLFKMYKEQGYSAKNAVAAILKNNLYGLEIDDRAMQLARFAVLLKAAQALKSKDPALAMDLVRNPEELIPHIYAFPESRSFSSEDIVILTGGAHTAEIYKAFELLRQGKNLGSVIQLELSEAAIETLKKAYEEGKKKIKSGDFDLFTKENWDKLRAYLEIALMLTKKYSAVVANPPYMGRKSMNVDLKDYLEAHYPLTKADLFAVFIEVCLEFATKKGLMGMINQHSWMFLPSYEKLRNYVLENFIIKSMLHLGPRTFEELSGEVVQSTAFVIENDKNENATGNYYRLVEYKSNIEKEKRFLENNDYFLNVPQSNFHKVPGIPITYWVQDKLFKIIEENIKLGDYAEPRAGLQTSDNARFLRLWHEVQNNKIGQNLEREIALKSNYKWFPHNKGGGSRKWYGNNELIINFKNDGEELKHWLVNNPNDPTTKHWSRNLRNYEHYFKEGLTWGAVSSTGITCRYTEKGKLFDTSGPMIFGDYEKLIFLLGFINSNVFNEFLELFSQTLSKGSGEFSKVPVIHDDNPKIINFTLNNIALSKADWNSRETSWDFEINPLLAQKEKSIKEAFSKWQEKLSQNFFQLHQNEEELNRIFIDIYGLQDELTPDVPLRDITILQDELKADDLDGIEEVYRNGEHVELPIQKDVVIQQLLSYFIGVLMGRYRLDKGGLHIAHPSPSEEELASYQVKDAVIPFEMEIDEDAILPFMGSSCAFPDDVVKRIQHLIHHIWGDESLIENQNFIQECLGMSMEKWLTEKFWKYHISGTMYKKKPIYWLFSSNAKKPQNATFNVLVYMHRMDPFTCQTILRKYLHPHQEYVKSQYEKLREHEVELSKEGQRLLERWKADQVELQEYEQLLKAKANQQISFDLDDGVTINYAKFKGVVAKI